MFPSWSLVVLSVVQLSESQLVLLVVVDVPSLVVVVVVDGAPEDEHGT